MRVLGDEKTLRESQRAENEVVAYKEKYRESERAESEVLT